MFKRQERRRLSGRTQHLFDDFEKSLNDLQDPSKTVTKGQKDTLTRLAYLCKETQIASRHDLISSKDGSNQALVDYQQSFLDLALHTEIGDIFARQLDELKTERVQREDERLMSWREPGATWEKVAERLAKEENHLKENSRVNTEDADEIPVHEDIIAASKALGLSTEQISFAITTYASRCQMAHSGLTDLLRDHDYDTIMVYLVKCRALAAQAPHELKRRYLQNLEHFSQQIFRLL